MMQKPINPLIFNNSTFEARVHDGNFNHIFLTMTGDVISLDDLEEMVMTLRKWQAQPPVEWVADSEKSN